VWWLLCGGGGDGGGLLSFRSRPALIRFNARAVKPWPQIMLAFAVSISCTTQEKSLWEGNSSSV
jgi:hypothetical protein